MANESVSKLLRVKQGKTTINFERIELGLVVEYFTQRTQRPVRFTLKEPAVDALKELLGSYALTRETEPSSSAFQMEEVPAQARTVPPEGLQGRQTEEGLVRSEDGIEAGME